jgi:pilus assembly protein CpaE
MSDGAEVLIISQDPEAEQWAAALRSASIVAHVAATYAEALSFVERAATGSPAPSRIHDFVAVLDSQLPADVAFQSYKLLHTAHPMPTLMAVPMESYRDHALDPHRSQLDEYLPKPIKPAELVLRVQAMMVRSGYEVPVWNPLVAGDPPGGMERYRRGQIVSVFAAKGGVGKTTIAVNLAVGLTRYYHRQVLVIDGDLAFGDVGVRLNVASNKSLFDVCSGDDIEYNSLADALVQHNTGVSLLLRPATPAMSERVDLESVSKALLAYKSLFDFVIVDTFPSLNDLNHRILEASDRIIVVTTPEISSVYSTYRFLEVAENLGHSHKVLVVLNRANSGLRLEALERELGINVDCTVISAGRSVVEAANRGISLFTQDPHEEEEITRDLARIVEVISGRPRSEVIEGGPFEAVGAAGDGGRRRLPFRRWRGR